MDRSISDDGLYIVKEMHFTDEGRSFIERVRLYDPSTLRQMFADAGLTVTDAFGDYAGVPLRDDSERVILVAVTS